MKRRWAALPVFALACFAPRVADAFLVVGKSKTAPSVDRVSVTALREGGHTVLSVQPHLKDKAGEIAVLIPVPAVQETSTLATRAFAPLARVSSPRIVELWELDPCKVHAAIDPAPIPSDSASAGPAAPPKPPPPKAPTVGPDPSVGYTFETLEGKGADVLAKLDAAGFTVPASAQPVLTAYLDGGMKLVVAKIDSSKVDDGVLPPLAIHTSSADLSLPTRLLATAESHPSLELYVLAPNVRLEAKDLTNLAIPTNLDFASGVRPKLDSFYGSLLDRAFEKKPGAVITEYAWRASTCDGCAEAPSARTVAGLGLSLLPSAKEGMQHEVIVDAEGVSSEPGGPEALQKSLSDCYTKALADHADVRGTATITVEVAEGAVTKAELSDSVIDAPLGVCALEAVKAAKLDKSGKLGVEFSPVSRKYWSNLVLTKLRARYPEVPEKDLVLRAAGAIEGGREASLDGKAPKKVALVTEGNDFQARYVIRHPWGGKVACDSPESAWSVKAPKGAKSEAAKPAAGLDASIEGGAPDLDAFVIPASDPPAPPAPSAAPSSSASPNGSGAPPAPAPPATSAAPPPSALPPAAGSGGCGCEITTNEPAARSGVIAAAAVLLAFVRRRRRTFRTAG